MRGPKRLAHTATAGLKRLHPHEVQLRCAYAATAGAGLRCAEKWRLRVAMKQEQKLGLLRARGDVVVSQLAGALCRQTTPQQALAVLSVKRAFRRLLPLLVTGLKCSL